MLAQKHPDAVETASACHKSPSLMHCLGRCESPRRPWGSKDDWLLTIPISLGSLQVQVSPGVPHMEKGLDGQGEHVA